MRLDIYHHLEADCEEKDFRKTVLEALNIQSLKLEAIMANEQQFKDALQKIADATTTIGTNVIAVGTRIAALEAAITNAGLPADVEASLLAQLEGVAPNLEAIATTLASMGNTPTDPIPDPVPDPLPDVPVEE